MFIIGSYAAWQVVGRERRRDDVLWWLEPRGIHNEIAPAAATASTEHEYVRADWQFLLVAKSWHIVGTRSDAMGAPSG